MAKRPVIGRRKRAGLADLGSMVGDRRALSVEALGLTVELVYDMALIDTEAYHRMLALIDPDETAEGLAAARERVDQMRAFVGAVLVEWNLTSSGEPVGTDEESLRRVPVALLREVFFAVLGDQSPDPLASEG
ncbi:MAG: hypothetical protein KF884_10660 [Fimbriimonadaceae bacterium]|nr:hypothetical protein [Fimbriimonadaceae bacterium]QYK58007.1 MAG: hypothetical protein KF884_10660 [Fimbriimonadaceae bacterium]